MHICFGFKAKNIYTLTKNCQWKPSIKRRTDDQVILDKFLGSFTFSCER